MVYEFAMIVNEEVIFPCSPGPVIGWKLVSVALKYKNTVFEHDSPGDVRAVHTISLLPIVTNDSTAHCNIPLNATWHVSSTLSLGHSLSVVSVQTGGEEDWRLCSHQANKNCNFVLMYDTFLLLLIAHSKVKG